MDDVDNIEEVLDTLICKRCNKPYRALLSRVAYIRKRQIRNRKWCYKCKVIVDKEKTAKLARNNKIRKFEDKGLTPEQIEVELDKEPYNARRHPTWDDRVDWIFNSVTMELPTVQHPAPGPDLWARCPEDECKHGRLPHDRTAPCGCWPIENLTDEKAAVQPESGSAEKSAAAGREQSSPPPPHRPERIRTYTCKRCGIDFQESGRSSWFWYCRSCRPIMRRQTLKRQGRKVQDG